MNTLITRTRSEFNLNQISDILQKFIVYAQSQRSLFVARVKQLLEINLLITFKLIHSLAKYKYTIRYVYIMIIIK